MENSEEIRQLIAILAPVLVAIITGGFLVFQQKQKERAEKNSLLTIEGARKIKAETAKQLADAASVLIEEYQGIMKTLKEEYDTKIKKVLQEVDAVKQENERLNLCNTELENKYNQLLLQYKQVIEDNNELRKELNDLRNAINGKEDEPCLTE